MEFSGIHRVNAPNPRVKIGKRLTAADVHVDRLETTQSMAYMQLAENFVAGRAFPNIPSQDRSNLYALYTKSFWLKSQMLRRAPGAGSAELHYGVDNTNSYTCNVMAGHMPLDEQTAANAQAPYEPARDNQEFMTQQALLFKEIEWAAAYFAQSIWGTDATPGTKWDQSSSSPISEMRTGLRTVQQNTGIRPNIAIFGQQAWDIIVDHADLVGRTDRGQTTGTALVTRQTVAALLELDEVLVMGSVQNTDDVGQSGTYAFIGDTDAVLLLHRPARPGRRTPSAGYTYSWSGLLGANALGGRITSWFEPSRKADIQEIELAYTFVVTGADLGYFIHTVST